MIIWMGESVNEKDVVGPFALTAWGWGDYNLPVRFNAACPEKMTMANGFQRVEAQFRVERQGDTTLWLRLGDEEALTQRGIADPERLFQSGGGRPVSGRTQSISIPLDARDPNGRRILLRPYAHGGLLARLNRRLFLNPERPLRELEHALLAEQRGVNTARPLAVVKQQRGRLYRAYFVCEEIGSVEDGVHFARRVSRGEVTLAVKRAVICEVAREVRRMHDVGLIHGDLHLKNLLIRVNGPAHVQAFVIDFDLSRSVEQVSLSQRLGNLMRLGRSVRKIRWSQEGFTRTDGLRFLFAYWPERPRDNRRLQRWARTLRASGRLHALWWRLIGAKRDIPGDMAPEAKHE